jgi:ATP-binding cassette subfamily F protein 3
LKHARKAYDRLTVFRDVSLHIERGDRIALVGPNGTGKSTLMRMLSGEETPDSGTRTLGHQVVMEYFAQDEATRLDPALTVYETLASGSPNDMVPAIRNILGGFLFSGDDVYKKAGVLSGGERTRLAVARMLLRPSNTLLLDEPTNHLDLDSKDVLLDALEDYGGTLIIVSHDRYFVERLATKIIEIGHGEAVVYPGTYTEFLWHKEHPAEQLPTTKGPTPKAGPKGPALPKPNAGAQSPKPKAESPKPQVAKTDDREARKRQDAERKKQQRAAEALQKRIADLEGRIAEREATVKNLETAMSAPGFYDDREASKLVIEQHQALMWEVGDLMAQWEALQEHASQSES